MAPKANPTDNPYSSPRNSDKAASVPRPFEPSPKPLWYIISAIAIFVVAFLIIHNVSMERREQALIAVAFAIVPIAIAMSCLPRPVHYWGIFASLFAIWLALAYCGDMGGPYAHFLTAGLVGIAELLALVVSSVIVFCRGDVHRKRKRAYMAWVEGQRGSA